MGASLSHLTSRNKIRKLKSVAHLEHSYSCYTNADEDTKPQLRKRLIEACSEGDCDTVTNLLQLGVPVDSAVSYPQFYQYSREDDKEINTLFSLLPEESTYDYAKRASVNLREKRVKVLKVLVDYGINLNLKDSNGETVLHKLCKVALAVDFSVFKEIVQLGCDIHCVDISGNSLLHCCCSEEKLYNKKSMLKYLLENGLDPDLQNSSGETALHFSAKCCNDAHIKLLMDHNANINIQNFTERKTPLHLAILSIQCSSGVHSNISLDASLGSTAIRTLLSYGPDVNLQDRHGITAFGEALNQGLFVPYTQNELCQEFIRCGADLTAADSSGNTILHICYISYLDYSTDKKEYAVSRLNADVQKYINYGASVNVRNSCNRYPVDYLIKYISIMSLIFYMPTIEAGDMSLLCKTLKYHIEAGLDVKYISAESKNILHIISNLQTPQDPSWYELVQIMFICGFKFNDEQEMPFQSLKRLCANYIRLSLRPNAIVGLSKLELPSRMKNYISMV